MTKMMTAADAKAHFSDCVRIAEHGHAVMITRNGKPVAVLVAADELKQIVRLRAAGPMAGLASLVGGWKGSDEFVRQLDRSPRTPPRVVVDGDD